MPKDDGHGRIPDVEWWDAHILDPEGDGYATPGMLRDGAINNYIEHPIQMKTLEPKAVHMPVFLTKKEQKKLRRQNRREMWKDKQVRNENIILFIYENHLERKGRTL